MDDYVIAAASTADLPKEYFEEHNVPLIRYSYMIDDKSYEDDCDEHTREKIYKGMRAGTYLTTSMINTYTYHEFFKGIMETGKNLIYLDMSKKMSHSYVTANEAAEQIKTEFPNQKIYVMDTLCISGGLGLLLISMQKLKEEGKSFDEVIKWGEENKFKIMHHFTVDDLKYLKRGGRVSNASAMVGSLLNIKPVLYVPDDGTLTVSGKVRGRKAALLSIFEKMKVDLVDPTGQTIYINHADCLEDAEFMKKMILQQFPTVAKVSITSLGVIIGAHCGPGLFTIFYFGDKRRS
jgi:DegV family protein with EDD domain